MDTAIFSDVKSIKNNNRLIRKNGCELLTDDRSIIASRSSEVNKETLCFTQNYEKLE